MNAVARLSAFVAVLLAVFAAAAFAGDRIGWSPRGGDGTATRAAHAPDAHGHDAMAMPATAAGGSAPGLSVSQDGLTLAVQRSSLPPGATRTLRFRILDASGRPVRRFEIESTKRLHLIVVRRDLTGFQHLHPVMAADGTWSTRLRLPRAGDYRVFTDFVVGGTKRVLGADLAASGSFAARPLPRPAPVAEVDGYRVALAEGSLRAGREATLRFTVTRDGRAVTPAPYLGARGHLVALREGDLAYSHVHPDANSLSFMSELPTAGRYRLFLQFRAGGRLHTAAFTQEVSR